MHRFLILLLILVTVILTLSPCHAESFIGKCVGIYDGDTIRVEYEGEDYDIRLDGVDCPEENQSFHKEARQFTSDLLSGKDILVELIDEDQYGRCIARVKIGYRDLSLELVRAGLAWHYKKYSSDPAIAQAEEEAKKKKKGIWSMENPVAPWEHRQMVFNHMMPPIPAESPAENEQIMYITVHGECYHLETCPSMTGESKAIPLEEAIKQGYRPCRICNPPTR